jgi:SAM-dependent methyltransferase
MAPLSHTPPADWIPEHQRIWARKPGLRAVYGRWFRWVRSKCLADGSIVEIGCGPGFLKAAYPEVIATDVVPNPFADRQVDAGQLPFASGTVGSIVMVDVFHHLAAPDRFLHEVARALQPGGRLIMLEPWISLAGRFVWTYVHHEGCDLSVRPDAPWDGAEKDPMAGNAALPYLYFREGGHLGRVESALRVVEREPFPGLPWLLSGGFQSFTALPGPLVGLAERLDRALAVAPRLTATRCLITIERTC